mgnify:CR=1 FL=1
MAQVLWGTKTPGQAYDQRDEVILANKRKVRMYKVSHIEMVETKWLWGVVELRILMNYGA